MSTMASDYGIGSKVRSQPKEVAAATFVSKAGRSKTVSLVFHRKCRYADDTTLYLIVSFGIVALIEVCRQHA